MRMRPSRARWAAFVVGLAVVSAPVPGLGATFAVTDTADLPDSDLTDQLCLDANELCSLRAAIQEANLTATKDTINFALGTGVQTIDLTTPLPDVVKPITVNGGLDAMITTTHGVSVGLTLAAGSDMSTVAGVIVSGFATGIRMQAGSLVLSGSRIGTNGDGTGANGNTVAGVAVEGSAARVITSTISGNAIGVVVTGDGATLSGNRIGLNAAGTGPVPNGTGVLLSNVTGFRRDGCCTGSGADRVAHNTGDGIRIAGTSNDNEIDSAQVFNNGGAGVAVDSTARNNRIWLFSAHDNGGLAIDLLGGGGTTGPTANDAGDGDSGANDLQNYPAGKAGSGFTTLRVLSAGTVIQGGLQSEPNKSYRIDFYQSPSCEQPPFGEGTSRVNVATNIAGCTQLTTDATGYADIGCQLVTAVTTGWFVTATATGGGGTSELSECSATTTTSSTSTTTSTFGTTTTTSSSSSSTSSTSSSTSTSTSTSTTKPTSTTVPSTTSTSTSVPTTSTSTTSSSSTVTTPSTTSTSTSTVQTTSTSSTTAVAQSTTSTSSSSTTTTSRPSCGDGTVTPPERCDPAAPGSELCCNPATCLPVSAGGSCGLERDACGAPVCDGAGGCITKPALQGFRCREPGSIGPCDPGAVCGIEPGCPSEDTASGCEALNFDLTANTSRLRFRCKAKASDQGPVRCGAELVAGQSVAPVARRRRPTKLDATPASDCSGAQFDTTLPKKLAQVSRSELARFIVARISKTDRQYFAPGKTVCVRVRFTAGNGYSQTRLYNVRVP